MAFIKQRDPKFLNNRKTFYKRAKLVGYIRESPMGKTVEAQTSELKKEGCKIIFQDLYETQQGLPKEMGQLESALQSLNEGDELVISTLDRLGISLAEVIANINSIQRKGAYIKTVDGLLNTKSHEMRIQMIFEIMNSLLIIQDNFKSEQRYLNIKNRRLSGMNPGGRPRINQSKEALVLRLRNEGNSYRAIREQTGLALSTIRRIIVEE